MTTSFDERERAAEGLFVQDQQRQFLARRRGIEVTAAWAAEAMELTPEEQARYAQAAMNEFILGASEDRLIMSMQTDLERAGKPTLSTQVATVLSQAVANAALDLRGRPDASGATQNDPRAEWERHHRRSEHHWGWGL